MNVNMKSKQGGFISLGAIKSFFQFSNISVYLIIGLVLAYGYWKIQTLEAQNETLVSEKEGLVEKVNEAREDYNTLVDDVEEFKDSVREDLEDQRDINKEINRIENQSKKRIEELRKKFNESSSGEERDMEEIAERKPDMLERRINDATGKVGEKVESITSNNDDSESEQRD